MSVNFNHDLDAERAVAGHLRARGDDVRTHGETLSSHTQGRVGSGPLGEVADTAVSRIMGAFSEGFSGALSEFFHGTADVAERNAKKLDGLEAETKAKHDSIGPPPYDGHHGGPLVVQMVTVPPPAYTRPHRGPLPPTPPPPTPPPPNVLPKGGVALHHVDQSAIPADAVFRGDDNTLYRRDNQPPDKVFSKGLHPWVQSPTNPDLAHTPSIQHWVADNPRTSYVATSRDPNLKWTARYLYTIDAPGGIDVQATFDATGHDYSAHEFEQEITFPGGIDTQRIVGVNRVWPSGELGKWIRPIKGPFKPNPNHVPRV